MLGLEGLHHLHQERMIQVCADFHFVSHRLPFILVSLNLLHELDHVKLSVFEAPYQIDFAESPNCQAVIHSVWKNFLASSSEQRIKKLCPFKHPFLECQPIVEVYISVC